MTTTEPDEIREDPVIIHRQIEAFDAVSISVDAGLLARDEAALPLDVRIVVTFVDDAGDQRSVMFVPEIVRGLTGEQMLAAVGRAREMFEELS